MSSELRDLYQELILEHNKKPRNFKAMENANHKAEGFNPLCGDKLTLYLLVENNVIKDVTFQGSGCAISKASASLMTENLKGKTQTEAETVFQAFHQMLSGHEADTKKLGKLAVFSGVCEFPARVKCATLAWHTLRAGLEGQAVPVSTEKGG